MFQSVIKSLHSKVLINNHQSPKFRNNPYSKQELRLQIFQSQAV